MSLTAKRCIRKAIVERDATTAKVICQTAIYTS